MWGMLSKGLKNSIVKSLIEYTLGIGMLAHRGLGGQCSSVVHDVGLSWFIESRKNEFAGDYSY